MTTSRWFLRAACAALLTVAAGAVAAQPIAAPAAPVAAVKKPAVKPVTVDKPSWSQLTPAQQVALEPLHAEWDPMPGLRKQKWMELANRYASMKPEEQARVHERMRDWVKLTPDQRNLARQNYTEAKKIAPNEKSANWESYQQLPDEQKQKLAEQAARKQVANLPRAKVQRGGACPAGSVKNTVSATPACVPAAGTPAAGTPAAGAPGATPAAAPSTAPRPAAPVPVRNAN